MSFLWNLEKNSTNINMIKDQCNNCKKYNTSACIQSIVFDSTPCQEYVKKIDLSKSEDKFNNSFETRQDVNSVVDIQTQIEENKSFQFSSLFSFKGRHRRSLYWAIGLCGNLVMLPANIAGEDMSTGVAIFTLIFIVPVAWIALANNVKRFHDLGKSGWWVLGLCIPIVNLLLAIYLGFFKGEECDNQYGPDPYE